MSLRSFGCLTSTLNGKCWTNAFRAFRMLVEALLHDFLSDGEKSYNDIVDLCIWRARSHPTGKMWVDTIKYPTFLAMELVRAELLQQDCLWRMLPLLFAAGHHWYARYTIAFLLEMQNLPAAAKSDITSGAHVCRHSDGCETVSADQFGEQMYIRQGKGTGGLKGISTNGDQVAVWMASFPICSQLIDTFDGS